MRFNPFDAAFKADPCAVYAELREHAPALEPNLNFWPISRYDDVNFVLKNHALFSSSAMGVGPMGADGKGTRSIISSDPPDHTLLRGLVNRAFTPRMVAEMEPRIREITRELLSCVAPSGHMDRSTCQADEAQMNHSLQVIFGRLRPRSWSSGRTPFSFSGSGPMPEKSLKSEYSIHSL